MPRIRRNLIMVRSEDPQNIVMLRVSTGRWENFDGSNYRGYNYHNFLTRARFCSAYCRGWDDGYISHCHAHTCSERLGVRARCADRVVHCLCNHPRTIRHGFCQRHGEARIGEVYAPTRMCPICAREVDPAEGTMAHRACSNLYIRNRPHYFLCPNERCGYVVSLDNYVCTLCATPNTQSFERATQLGLQLKTIKEMGLE